MPSVPSLLPSLPHTCHHPPSPSRCHHGGPVASDQLLQEATASSQGHTNEPLWCHHVPSAIAVSPRPHLPPALSGCRPAGHPAVPGMRPRHTGTAWPGHGGTRGDTGVWQPLRTPEQQGCPHGGTPMRCWHWPRGTPTGRKGRAQNLGTQPELALCGDTCDRWACTGVGPCTAFRGPHHSQVTLRVPLWGQPLFGVLPLGTVPGDPPGRAPVPGDSGGALCLPCPPQPLPAGCLGVPVARG